MEKAAEELRVSMEAVERMDHHHFDVIGAVPKDAADPRDGLYVVVKEKAPYRKRLMVEVEDPDHPEDLARIRQLLRL
ncbi:hypothetical protein ACFPTY_18555 [Halomonas beimenensis]|uniref:Uncharacterized protein n=1 Tax=Halomonas beimenensis TaxID=475662 RepID=A0A291P2X8_9GAMM|nr:hypothetical protein [Halomonas beimenensis]ATJ81220.1 hypothetical protein BEI_0233 [Halomonas beimenensis]